MTPSSGTPTPLDVLREALALHLSMAASGEQPTARSLSSLDNGLAALSDVETLVEAASRIEGWLADLEYTEATFYVRDLRNALRPFAGDGNERAT